MLVVVVECVALLDNKLLIARRISDSAFGLIGLAVLVISLVCQGCLAAVEHGSPAIDHSPDRAFIAPAILPPEEPVNHLADSKFEMPRLQQRAFLPIFFKQANSSSKQAIMRGLR